MFMKLILKTFIMCSKSDKKRFAYRHRYFVIEGAVVQLVVFEKCRSFIFNLSNAAECVVHVPTIQWIIGFDELRLTIK